MTRRSWAGLFVTLLTLGSGLLNVYSVTHRGLPERIEVLRKVFPLEFLHLSRTATLLIGFALVVSSLNVYKRKRAAWWIALLLACSSVLFHLTKGVDYEEAGLSALLAAVLVATRRNFTVRSGLSEWPAALKRSLLALVLAAAYGVAGFWLLEPREFGINFGWQDSLIRTTRFLTFMGDPSLAPRTRHAEWFLDSLYVLSAAALLYAGFSLFRPVLYRFGTHPQEVAHARAIVARYGRCPQDFFKARPDKSLFFDADSFLAYRVAASYAVVLGDPVGPEQEIEGIIAGFAALCRDNDWGLGFYQVLPDFLETYLRQGFKKLKVGDEAIVDLTQFTLEGKVGKPLRSKINTLEKSGIRTGYYAPPIPPALLAQLREVSDEWLQLPGRRERQFTLGMFDEDYVGSTPVFTAEDENGKVLAFVNLISAYRKGEATADLMRRRTEAPNGIMDYLFARLFLRSKEEGFVRFNLGLAPMSGFQEQEEASPEERAIHAFFQYLNFLFSFKGLLAYKAKFASSWEPRYTIYRSALDLPRLALALSRVSELPD
jgi:phosphatidylglycerol lysyltransferase